MRVESSNSTSVQAIQRGSRAANGKQTFDDLGKALESGDLTSAKVAFAQLQKNAPPEADQVTNPLSDKIDKLSQALDAGDLSAAKDAYNDIRQSRPHPSRSADASAP